MNASGEEFGPDRLAEAVKKLYDRPAREIIAGLQLEILEWTNNVGSHDDVTFFVIKALK
jgi:serine phosphatase RsbU (regulator of sigma subunit)